jgi:hypothetical protein
MIKQDFNGINDAVDNLLSNSDLTNEQKKLTTKLNKVSNWQAGITTWTALLVFTFDLAITIIISNPILWIFFSLKFLTLISLGFTQGYSNFLKNKLKKCKLEADVK